jgi:hypothetical protein
LLVASCAEEIRTIHSRAFNGQDVEDDDRALLDDTLKNYSEWKLSILTRLDEVINQKAIKTGTEKHHTKDRSEISAYGIFKIPETSLATLDFDTRKTILSSLLLLSLSLPSHNYDPRSRTLLHILCSSLRLPQSLLLTLEKEVARILVSAAMTSDEEEAKKRTEAASSSRKWKMGIAGVAGGILVGVTGYFFPHVV